MGYHTWRYNKRRNSLFLVTWKALNHDGARVDATWEKRSAANEWGKRKFGPGNFMVLKCQGPDCGIGGCRGVSRR